MALTPQVRPMEKALLALAALVMVCLAALPARADFLDRVDYTLTNQNGADFRGQNLSEASFAGVQGRQADFTGADLSGAIFTQAAFPESDFSAADLSDALLDRVDLHDAVFTGAVLRNVIASGSDFSGATVRDADFSDALLDRSDQIALCLEAEGTNPTTGVDTRLSLGCG